MSGSFGDLLQQATLLHSKRATFRFTQGAGPALTRLAESSLHPSREGIRTAREKVVARTDEARQDFLRKRGFSRAESSRTVETVLPEEGRPPESVFEPFQDITAVARTKPHQDARLAMEGKAKALLHRVA